MPKLNIYVDEDLMKRVQKYNMPISQICQQALWDAIEETERAVCKTCDSPALFHVKNDEGGAYACRRHLATLAIEGVSTVRAL
jgi:hypothetical protein